jgi:hypothetical protein
MNPVKPAAMPMHFLVIRGIQPELTTEPIDQSIGLTD